MSESFVLPFAVLVFALSGSASAQERAGSSLEQVGFHELSDGRNTAAIRQIEGNATLAPDDPARNINLAIAYARTGHDEKARTHFLAALASEERVSLQTSTGKWVDSRELARQGLRKLDSGIFTQDRFAGRR